MNSRTFELETAVTEVRNEALHAIEKWNRFNSAHEGFAVIKEEVDELWAEVKAKNHDKARMREEAKQIAAMCLRFMAELT